MPNGDTITLLGGGMIDEDYGATEYRRNGSSFLRIEKSVGRKPDGKPIWSTRARLALPQTDSSQRLLFAGMCGTDNKSDRFVLAIAVTEGDSVYRDIRHAWRFERVNETLRQIATNNVACWDIGPD